MIVFRTMICEVTVVFSIHVLLYVVGIHGLGTYLFMDVSIYFGTCRVAQYDQWHVFWFKSERRLKVTREGLNYLQSLKLFSFIWIEKKINRCCDLKYIKRCINLLRHFVSSMNEIFHMCLDNWNSKSCIAKTYLGE